MRRFLLTILILFTPLLAKTQISLGLKCGINDATITGSSSLIDKERLIGLNAGGVVMCGISNTFSIQLEPGYSRQGFKQTYLGLKPSLKTIIYLDYIQLPVLAKATFGKHRLKSFAYAGPHFEYLVSGKLIANYYYSKSEKKFDFSGAQKDVNRWDFGITCGGGIAFWTGPGDLFFDLRYSLGLIPVYEPPPFRNYTNSMFGFSLGYMIEVWNRKPRSR